jgi:hypothetical protein
LSASVDELSSQAAMLGAVGWLDQLRRGRAGQATANALRERMIRHTKSQRIDGEVALALPRASFRTEWLDLSTDESAAYQRHICMTASRQTTQSDANNAGAKHDARKLLTALEPWFRAQRLALCNHYTAEDVQCPQVTATKLSWLEAELRALRVKEPNMRVAVFTHNDEVQAGLVNWLSALASGEWVVDDLKQSLKATEKQGILQAFQSKTLKGARLFVATFKVAAVGLNLHNATRVYLLEPTFDPAVAVQAAGRVHRLGQSNEVKIVQLAYRSTLDEAVLAVHDQIRDGTLRLQDGHLPATVEALLDSYRRAHSFQHSRNDTDRATKFHALRGLSQYDPTRQRAEDDVPLPCSYLRCSSCGHIEWSSAVYELTVKNEFITYDYSRGPQYPPTIRDVFARVWPSGRTNSISQANVRMPKTAAVGDVFTFKVSQRGDAYGVQKCRHESSQTPSTAGASSSEMAPKKKKKA